MRKLLDDTIQAMKDRKILIPVIAGIVLALIGLAVFFSVPRQKNITILFENQSIEIRTNARTVGDALEEFGFTPIPEDEIEPAAERRLRQGQTISYTPAIKVRLSADGQEQSFFSTKRVPAEWLDEAGLSLAPEDRLYLNNQLAQAQLPIIYQTEVQLDVRRAVTITLQSDSGQWVINSAAPTLGQALWESGFSFTISDILSVPPETPLTAPMTVQLQPGEQISIEVDGQTLNTAVSADTVGEALAQAGLPLQGLDYSIPDENAPLPTDRLIRIVRVREEVIINQETIPFETIYTALEDVEIDNYQVAQIGQVGIQGQRVRVRYEEGQETERAVEQEWTLKDPVPRIEGYGTKIVIRTLDTGSGTIEYWRAVQMYATSYSPCNSGAERCYPYTSLGYEVKQGVVAVIYDWFIPMGNHTVYVPGYGNAIIADVGGGIEGRHWIDLGYTDENYIPWAQWVTVYFTTPIPPADEILWVLPYK